MNIDWREELNRFTFAAYQLIESGILLFITTLNRMYNLLFPPNVIESDK